MGALKMDSDGLHALAAKFNQKAGALDALTSTFQTNCNSITDNSTWEGVDSEAFATAAANFKAQLDSASTLLKDIGSNFEATASNYDETLSGVTARNNSL